MDGPIFLCGGRTTPGPRGTDCPDSLHDHPLPAGYIDAAEEAARRLRNGWSNRRCARCGLFGWGPGARTTTNDERTRT